MSAMQAGPVINKPDPTKEKQWHLATAIRDYFEVEGSKIRDEWVKLSLDDQKFFAVELRKLGYNIIQGAWDAGWPEGQKPHIKLLPPPLPAVLKDDGPDYSKEPKEPPIEIRGGYVLGDIHPAAPIH